MNTLTKKHINLSQLSELKKILRKASLHTVCEEALCPNIGECFQRGTATFLIAGKICTRNCGFCSIEKGETLPLDPEEPKRIAETVKKLNLKYVVITSVTRDDLNDGGAEHFVNTINSIRQINPDIKIEVLVPDFRGDKEAAMKIFTSKPYIFNHNLETVPRLYQKVRPKADYERSLKLIFWAKENNLSTKSGLMLGMGEKEQEVMRVMDDLRRSGCDILTLGQYLAPTKNRYPVKEYLKKEIFEFYRKKALEIGFINCQSSTYVRSSYMADMTSDFRPQVTDNKY
ncbi:MAG: lipoyl synthase [Elusimicrobia bacterium]|nr:lipoyl synthase [Candidatus Liberimonas magnetica]